MKLKERLISFIVSHRVKSVLILFTVTCIINISWVPNSDSSITKDTPIWEVLNILGVELPNHARPEASQETVQRGYDLIHYGKTIGPNGKKSSYISKYYVCTSCHNQDREDPDLKFFNPDTRLDYIAERKMKFLQGSTFFGIANRESWYNEDYYLKYGDLVKPANKSLAEASQLCAKVCSSGRYLEDWELEAILAYYWNNQIKISDLDLSEEELKTIQSGSKANKGELVQLVKSKYALYSPATFGEKPADPQKGYPGEGNPLNGKKIYELSCQSCHSYSGVAGMTLDNSKTTFQKFLRNLDRNGEYNIYEISRHGTYFDKGKPRYMPLYPKERMSDQQLEDLKAYIIQEAS